MERRNFMKLLGLGAAGLYTASLQSCAAATGQELGLQLFSVRDAVAKDLEGTLERLVKMGYNKLEIYGYDGKFFGKTVAEFKSILAKTGMKVVSSHHLSGLGNKAPGSLSVGWDKAVDDLHELGVDYMACAYLFPEERTPENYAQLPALLNASGERCKQAGIRFAYHNHDFEFEPYNDTLVYDYLLTSTNPDLVSMELDLYWISKAKHDPVAYFDKYPGRFPLWHVKDMEKGTGDITEVGNGVIDFDRIFAAREKAGMKMWFVEQDVSKGDMFASLATSHRYLDGKRY